jgi:NCAIR mutase (PurE)-related protein
METTAIARLDHERRDRTGVPEVIFAAGKTLDQNVALVGALFARTGFALATRIPAEQRAGQRFDHGVRIRGGERRARGRRLRGHVRSSGR